MVYVPILDTLEKLLNNEMMMTEVCAWFIEPPKVARGH